MEEEKQINQNQSNGVNLPEDKSIDVRTMSSDLNSIEGEGVLRSYNPSVVEESNSSAPKENINLENLESKGANFVSQPVQETVQTTSGNVPPSASKNKKGLIIGVVIFFVIVGLAALAYFVILPLFSSKTSSTENSLNATSAVVTSQSDQNLPVVPPQEEATLSPETTSSQSEEVIVVTTSSNEDNQQNLSEGEKKVNHISPFIKVDEVVTSSKVITGKNISSLSLSSTNTPALVEIVFDSPEINFSSIMKELFGVDLTQSGLASAFDESYTTGFLYLDQNGTKRIGYIAKLKSKSDLVDEKTSLGKILEGNTNLKNIFSSDPGSVEGWKNGSNITSPHRYTLFSKSGYSIDYGWKENIFIISSSFEGFNKAVNSLK